MLGETLTSVPKISIEQQGKFDALQDQMRMHQGELVLAIDRFFTFVNPDPGIGLGPMPTRGSLQESFYLGTTIPPFLEEENGYLRVHTPNHARFTRNSVLNKEGSVGVYEGPIAPYRTEGRYNTALTIDDLSRHNLRKDWILTFGILGTDKGPAAEVIAGDQQVLEWINNLSLKYGDFSTDAFLIFHKLQHALGRPVDLPEDFNAKLQKILGSKTREVMQKLERYVEQDELLKDRRVRNRYNIGTVIEEAMSLGLDKLSFPATGRHWSFNGVVSEVITYYYQKFISPSLPDHKPTVTTGPENARPGEEVEDSDYLVLTLTEPQ